MFCIDCYCGSVKCVTAEGRREKDDRDITSMCVRLIFVYRKLYIHSLLVRQMSGSVMQYSQQFVCVMLDLKETLNCAASLIVNNLPYLWH